MLKPADSIFPLAVILTVLAAFSAAPAKNTAFQPGQIWLDANAVHINAHGAGLYYENGTYYWFGEHKIAGRAGNEAHVGVHCYSSTDLYNWTDRGIALKVSSDPNHPLTARCILERPKVIRNPRTGRYVLWFHLELKGSEYRTALTGVAVSDSVTGPYSFLKALRPDKNSWPLNVPDADKRPADPRVNSLSFGGAWLPKADFDLRIFARDFEKGQMSRDMTVFVDDDGKAYHLHASEENSTLHISLLTDDYLDFTGKYVRAFEGRFMEAPAVFKYKGKYYFIGSGCTGWSPNAARSAVADNIFGPWTELGNPCTGPKADTTFDSQSTFILPVADKKDAFIFIADRWNPENAIDGRYVWLPITFSPDNRPILKWYDSWTLAAK